MQCTNPISLVITKNKLLDTKQDLVVPCGKCLACRISKRREWKIRMLHELSYHDDASFITLTYSDQHLPTNNSLVKRDLQLFFKRLRKSYPNKIKYFACGEYGEQTHRPHYHAILFGLGLKDKQFVMDAWPYADWSVPTIQQKSFGIAEPDSIGYVAGYIDKKYSGELEENEYQSTGREPVFKLSSNGLGLFFILDNSSDLARDLCLRLNGKEYSLPRYYLKKLGIDNTVNADRAIEKDCEITELYTGLYMTSDDLYKAGLPKENEVLIEGVKRAKSQHDRNLQARSNLTRSKKV